MAAITIDGRRVSYFESGAGTPVVLLHAGGSSGRQWAKTASLLAHRFRVIAPDLWGFGETDQWSGPEELTHDHQALLVAGVADHLCETPVHVVGHSYGGATAVRLMLQRPMVVRTAVLIEPVLMPLLRVVGEEKLFREYFEMAQCFIGNAEAGSVDDAWRVFVDYRNGPDTWQALPEVSKKRFCAMTESTVAGFRSNLNNPTSLQDLARLSLPVLVLCGEKTTVPDRRVTEIVRAHIPQCGYDVIPNAEHMSPLTHSALVAQAIERHITNSNQDAAL